MPMRRPKRLLIAAGFVLAAALHSHAGDIKVIVNASVKTDAISTDELRGVFLLQRRSLKDGSSVVPVLQKEGPAHETFLKQYLERDAAELHIYYQGLVFTGKGSMPKELNSDAEVVAWVASTHGAMGYVNGKAGTEGVKILAVLSTGRSRERVLLKRVEPEYPETLQRLRISGTVRLALTISPTGEVGRVDILGGNPILGEAAAKAAKRWVYAPGPAQTTLEVSIPFNPPL